MGRKKTYQRDQVLNKAMKLFWKKGYEGTHLQELVAETGLNRFSLYKEFGGKDGLFQEAMTIYLKKLQEISADLRHEPLGLDNIIRYVDTLMKTDFSYGCFMVNTLTERFVLHDAITQRLRLFVKGAEESLLKNLKAARENDEIDAKLDIDALAKFLVVFDIGLVTHELLEPPPQDKADILVLLETLLRAPRP